MSDLLGQIYNSYKKPIYNYFYRLTFNTHISEELTQDTFLRAFKYLNTFNNTASIKTWLFKIARNVYLTFIKKASGIREEAMPESQVIDQKDDYTNTDRRMLIDIVMTKLAEEERTLIVLRDINGFNYAEISDIMGYTEGQVKIRLHRARKRFRSFYLDEVKEEQE